MKVANPLGLALRVTGISLLFAAGFLLAAEISISAIIMMVCGGWLLWKGASPRWHQESLLGSE